MPALEAAAEAVPFCLPVDRSQVERHLNPAGAAWPAGKRLADEPRAVRMVYYVVGDGYRAETVAGMKSAILDIQALYGHWTRAHGLGERTFRHETDHRAQDIGYADVKWTENGAFCPVRQDHQRGVEPKAPEWGRLFVVLSTLYCPSS